MSTRNYSGELQAISTALQEPGVEAVEAELARIIASSKFAHSRQLSTFLRYAVEQRLAGRESQLKETVIDFEVFGHNAAYDPRIDPIVRVIASRLRKRLQNYYQTKGQNDSVRVDLTKGSYVTVFSFTSRSETAPERSETPSRSLRRRPVSSLQPTGTWTPPYRLMASPLYSPDGSALLLSQAGKEVADLMLVDKAQ